MTKLSLEMYGQEHSTVWSSAAENEGVNCQELVDSFIGLLVGATYSVNTIYTCMLDAIPRSYYAKDEEEV